MRNNGTVPQRGSQCCRIVVVTTTSINPVGPAGHHCEILRLTHARVASLYYGYKLNF